MKTKTSIWAGILTLAVGVLLLIFNAMITSSRILIVGGILFLACGILNLAVTFLAKDNQGRRRMRGAGFGLAIIVSIAAIALGISILCFPQTFIDLTPLVFGTLVAMGALILFYSLAIASRPILLPGWLYIFPTLIAVGAVLIYMLHTPQDDDRMIIYTGASLCLFGVCLLIGGSSLAVHNHKERKQEEAQAKAQSRENDNKSGVAREAADIKPGTEKSLSSDHES